MEKSEMGVMERPPKSPNEKLLNFSLFFRGYILLGLISSVAVLSGYFWVLYSGGWHWGQVLDAANPLSKKAATMTFLGIVIMQVANVFACRTEVASMFIIGILTNKLLNIGVIFELALTAILIYVPFFHRIFDTYSVPFTYWLFYIPFIPILIGIEELRKWFIRKKLKNLDKH